MTLVRVINPDAIFNATTLWEQIFKHCAGVGVDAANGGDVNGMGGLHYLDNVMVQREIPMCCVWVNLPMIQYNGILGGDNVLWY